MSLINSWSEEYYCILTWTNYKKSWMWLKGLKILNHIKKRLTKQRIRIAFNQIESFPRIKQQPIITRKRIWKKKKNFKTEFRDREKDT